MQPRMADSYLPQVYSDMGGLSASVTTAAAVWPTANKAIYVPVIFPYPATLKSISFVAANGTGNYDLGLYDGYSKLLLSSTGSTAMTAAAAKTLTFASPFRVDGGRLYYGALALSSTSGSVWRANPAVTVCVGVGMAQEGSALPLKATMTPAAATSVYAPIFIFGVR